MGLNFVFVLMGSDFILFSFVFELKCFYIGMMSVFGSDKSRVKLMRDGKIF